MQELIKPAALKRGDLVGVFSPSTPGHIGLFREKYLHGVSELQRMGFRVTEGALTASQTHQGYRTAGPRERADELMGLFRNPDVKAIISIIGGSNSASLLDHLDFDSIRSNPKIFCGYSDVTSLHLAIGKHAGLSTFYGPAVMPSFGEFPEVLPYTRTSFAQAVGLEPGIEELSPPEMWSCQVRDLASGAWKTQPRDFAPNGEWVVRNPGLVEAPILIANLNTLLTLMGTKHFPDLRGHILILEDMEAVMSQQERRWTQLRQSGVLDHVEGLIVGKPEVLKTEDAPFTLPDLIEEVLGNYSFPRVYDFDCSHTSPMLTLAQGTRLKLDATGEFAKVWLLERMVV